MKTILYIKGMHCKSCVKLIESEFQDKVNSIKVEENGKAIIDFDEKKISEKQIAEIIIKAGYKVE